MADPSDFGVVRRLTVTSAPGTGGTKLDRRRAPGGSRDRQGSVLAADRIIVGARRFGGPPAVRGFLDGDILQVLVYDRVLDDAERRAGRGVPRRPSTAGRPRSSAPAGRPSASRWSPSRTRPPVQMLVPGFTVRELPVDLPNINNVRYRPDGKLVALAYDGNVYLLSDTDGDGLEDKVELFWENKGRLAPRSAWP